MLFLKSKGIVIAKKEIEEADRMINVFMEEYGKVSIFVKGIRKSKRRDKTAVDILSKTEFSFYLKNENIILSDFTSVESYKNIKRDIEKINISLYIFDILNKILVENGKNRRMFELVEKTLEYLDKAENMRKNYLLLVYFLYQVIKEEGIYTEKDINIFCEIAKRKVSILGKEVLFNLFNGNLKEVINKENYETSTVKEVILLLEKYININLDIGLNGEKILWGDLKW